MTTLHIEFDEAIADAARKKAQAQGKTVEGWVAEVVAQQVDGEPDVEWVARFLEGAERLKGNSGGWKWNRDELYEDE